MYINLTYTVNKKSIPDYVYSVLDCYGLSSKNIKNSVLFIIKNIFSSYTYIQENKTYQVKNKLHENQISILKIVNETIIELNAKLKNKHDVKFAEYNQLNKEEQVKVKEPKLVQFNLYSNQIDYNTYLQIINKILLENVIKHKELTVTEYKDYTLIHSHLAQAVVQQVCDEYSYYFKGLKEYYNTKANKDNGFTGKPKEPGYKAKHSKISFEISTQRFNSEGTVLLVGKKHRLYKNYNKTEILEKSIIDHYNQFNWLAVLEKDLKDKNIHYLNHAKNYSIVSLKIIPGKYKKLPKVEYVVKFEKELQGFYPELIAKANAKYGKDFFELKDHLKLNVIKDYFNNDDIGLNNIPYFMGLDLGVVNFAGVSFYTANRDKNYVISGKTLKSRIRQLDNKIDKKKKELCIETIKNIQSKKDKKEQLTRQELSLLNEYHKSIYENKIISATQERKLNITNDYIHKLSKCLIEECLNKEIKVIVVGKNKGWKNEINNGKSNNRNMYNFPHARFIELLKYKALLKDIVVIEVEESYTSKTSFIDNEELKIYKDKRSKRLIYDKEKDLTQGNENQSGKNKLLGKRINRKFITKEGIIVHADVNGSFNIVRKILLHFKYNKEKVNLKYELMELNMSKKVKLNNFYQQSLIKKQKLKNINKIKIKCEQSGLALSI